MAYNPEIHNRRTIRLKEYDYSSEGAYFVTLCAHGKERLFGGITDNVMHVNDAGRMLETVWRGLPERFPIVTLETFIVMPNHIHGVILLSDRRGEPCVRPNCMVDGRSEPCVRPIQQGDRKPRDHTPGDQKKGDHRPGEPTPDEHEVRPYDGTQANSLGRIIQSFKSLSTVEYIRGVRQSEWPPFPGRLWQRNYFERIIRDERELNNIREYIINNPVSWAEDPENQASETHRR